MDAFEESLSQKYSVNLYSGARQEYRSTSMTHIGLPRRRYFVRRLLGLRTITEAADVDLSGHEAGQQQVARPAKVLDLPE